MAAGAGAALIANKAQQLKPLEVAATDGYTTYYNEDLGFATRDPNDTHYVQTDSDGGAQTKGAALSTKSELKLKLKKAQDNYWIGVGGYAIYVSSGTSIRFLYLTYHSSSEYSRNIENNLTGLPLLNEDGTTDLKDVIGGKYYTNYADLTMRFDLTDRNAAKVEFFVEYQGVTYYPFKNGEKLGVVTYTHAASGFSSADELKAMAGVAGGTTGTSIFKFGTQYAQKDFSTVISGHDGTFSYDYIGDFTVSLQLSEQVTAFNEYLNGHLNDWKDENNQSVNIGDAIVINGKTFSYWVNYTDPYMITDSTHATGVHQFPTYLSTAYSPVTINVSATRIKFFFDTAYLGSSNIVITFKSSLFRSFYNNTVYTLSEDLTFAATLKNSGYGTVGTNVTFTKNPTETVGNYTITSATDAGEHTAAGGAKYRRYTLLTNIPRDFTNIKEAFPHDHYRYMFENVMFNGRPLSFYNNWGRANQKDFTDLTTPTPNLDYEMEHPAGNTTPKYNLVTYLKLSSNDTYYYFTVEIPNKLMEDFDYNSYSFALVEGSVWVTPSGAVRVNYSPMNKYAVDGFVENYMHLQDVPTSNHNDTGACRGSNGYYIKAKRAYNRLSADQKSLFASDATYADAKARYEAWAVANNDGNPYDGNDSIVSTLRVNIFGDMMIGEDPNGLALIIAVAIATVAMLSFLIIYKKKRAH